MSPCISMSQNMEIQLMRKGNWWNFKFLVGCKFLHSAMWKFGRALIRLFFSWLAFLGTHLCMNSCRNPGNKPNDFVLYPIGCELLDWQPKSHWIWCLKCLFLYYFAHFHSYYLFWLLINQFFIILPLRSFQFAILYFTSYWLW